MNQQDNTHTCLVGQDEKTNISPAVIKRLPRYFRYLRILIREGKSRISSGELSARMNVTASQIRQDLNCFGGFGQQGYGYNVNYLYAKICEILGVSAGIRAIIVGVGNLGRALVRSSMFEKRGVDVVGLFDVSPLLVGQRLDNLTVYSMSTLGDFCRDNQVDIAVLTLPKDVTYEVASQILGYGVTGFWNFTGQELDFGDKAIVENVHLGDSLMTLCYRICDRNDKQAQAQAKKPKELKSGRSAK